MASLSPASAAAIARLRSYVPPPATWHSLPLSRRAAVLILLFADKHGDLRVVLTMRAATLKSYAGHAALPGGKSDTLTETPLMTARREAYEEIGLPMPSSSATTKSPLSTTAAISASPDPSQNSIGEDTKYSPPTPALPYPFRLEHLCQLPTNLAKTELGVRPCVAFLSTTSHVDRQNRPVDTESTLIPRLDAKEVAAVFSAPLHNFLRIKDERYVPPPAPGKRDDVGKWYSGQWIDWHETPFRMHNFFVPVAGSVVTRPQPPGQEVERRDDEQSPSSAPYPRTNPQASLLPYRDAPSKDKADPLESLARFRVWGMTARILVDCARVAYGEEPEFEHNSHFGDEGIIQRLIETGRLAEERSKGDEFEGGDLRRALEVGKGKKGRGKKRKHEGRL